jgi:hypothetical protein
MTMVVVETMNSHVNQENHASRGIQEILTDPIHDQADHVIEVLIDLQILIEDHQEVGEVIILLPDNSREKTRKTAVVANDLAAPKNASVDKG